MHPTYPVVHRYRFYAAMSLAPKSRPPVALRYAMWANASALTEKYKHHQHIFYRRARKYLQIDEMGGAGQDIVSLAHVQAWALLGMYEFKNLWFPRAWLSVGRAARMTTMLGLNRVDREALDAKTCLPPPKDWIEQEERRRTFWITYCMDRYASLGTGWPHALDQRDISSRLPATEEAFDQGIPQVMPFMSDLSNNDNFANLSPFAGVVYVTHFFGLNLVHLNRPDPDDNEHDPQGKFWRRHRHMDNALSNACLALPAHLRLPHAIRSPNAVVMNFSIHTSSICLHQAAVSKAEKHNLSSSLIQNSRSRCLLSAMEVANIMRMTSHLDFNGTNPFMTFSIYVAARVLVQYLKLNPQDAESKQALEFLLLAMASIRTRSPLSESFMIQLNLDIESNGIEVTRDADYALLMSQIVGSFSFDIHFSRPTSIELRLRCICRTK